MITSVINRLRIRVIKLLASLQWRSRWLRKTYLFLARRYTGRDGLVQRGAAKGLKFNAGAARNAGFLLGTYEPEVQRIYYSLIEPGFTVYDVGANVGFLSMLAAKLTGTDGSVVCFEPLPNNADLIEHNAA